MRITREELIRRIGVKEPPPHLVVRAFLHNLAAQYNHDDDEIYIYDADISDEILVHEFSHRVGRSMLPCTSEEYVADCVTIAAAHSLGYEITEWFKQHKYRQEAILRGKGINLAWYTEEIDRRLRLVLDELSP